MNRKPTKAELRWCKKLEKLLSEHPKNIWLFNTGEMCIMKKDGKFPEHLPNNGVNPANCIYVIPSWVIPSDGGDW